MHNLEQLIAEWRKTNENVPRETLDELENHLRETAEQFVRSGMSEADAFRRAVAELGEPSDIASEFKKLNEPLWLPLKIAIGFGVLTAAVLMIVLCTRNHAVHSGLLLASHIFTIVLGYTAMLLTGALGICFVCQRCFADFAQVRLRSLARACSIFAGIGGGLAIMGVILAMFWAKAEWGRYWDWDLKEIGGLVVIVWSVTFLVMHRLNLIRESGLMLMTLLGNIVVSLAWFGPAITAKLHAYGTSNYSLPLAAAIVIHLILFFVGLAPAGWLRPKNA